MGLGKWGAGRAGCASRAGASGEASWAASLGRAVSEFGRERTRLGARWRGRKGADVRGRLVRRVERLAWCRGKVEEAGHGAGIGLLGRVSGEEEKEKGSWAVGAGLGQGEWCWAGGKRERADRAGPAWEKVKRWVRPGFKLGWVSFGLLWVWV